MRQFGTPQSGCVKHHQENAVEHSRSGVDEFRYLLCAEDLGKPESLPWIWCFSNGPGPFQRRHEEESKRCCSLVHCIRSQFALTEQIRLVFAKLVRAELIRWTFEIARQILDRSDVGVY